MVRLGRGQSPEVSDLSARDIESIFQGPVSVFPDPEHCGEEERFIGIGKTEKHRNVLVVFKLRRKDDVVLPSNQRAIHAQERNPLL